MREYLGVTLDPATDEIQIICPTPAEAQVLADDLRKTFDLPDEKTPQVTVDKITYRGNVWMLKQFLVSRRWKLTMDTKTRLMLDRAHDDSIAAG